MQSPNDERATIHQDAPYWLQRPEPRYPSIKRSKRVDVAIIGSGITGLTAAYLLKKHGFSVAVLEKEFIGAGDSGHTTAHLTYVTDTRLVDLKKNFGADHAHAVWDAGRAALEFIHETVHKEAINCGFRHLSAYLHQGEGKMSKEQLYDEWQAAVAGGFDSMFIGHTPLFGDFGIEYFHQALFNPLPYLQALAAKVDGGGSYVFEHSDVTDFSTEPLVVGVNGADVSCQKVIIATHNQLQATQSTLSALLMQTKLYPHTSYVIRAELVDQSLPAASYFDTADPYYYLRIDRNEGTNYAIYGGLDSKTGQDEGAEFKFNQLEENLRCNLQIAEITHRWTGQVIATPDGIPYIGPIDKNCYIGTGYSGNGYTFGTLAGIMFSDEIRGIKNPWSELFDPSRKALRGGALNYVRENLDYPYYFIKDWTTKAEDVSLDSLGVGEGKIIRHQGQRIAAYRPENGPVVLLSPACTHLGCMVHWNAANKSWECPCHGSRFSATGEIEAGPAERNLTKLDFETEEVKDKIGNRA